MWSLILYFLFGIDQPSSSQPMQGSPATMQTTDDRDPNDGDGGDLGQVRSPKG